jgi:capsular exopolysaccharide synthesis family protein
MMTPASLSQAEKSPSSPKYLAAGILAGLILGYGIAFTRQRFDTRLRTADDITERFTTPILAVLPQSKAIARTQAASEGDFHAGEALRKLRTNLRYANVDHQARVILITSPQQNDGKSSVAANLAKVIAMAGDDVVIIDADLRRPSVADTYGIRGPLGLLQVLVGSARVENVLRPSRIAGLSILPTFDTPPNPSELLGSGRMAELVKYLSRDRIVILDAPPVLPVTDAVVLAHLADAVVMVASAGRTRAEQLDHALGAIERGEGDVAGVVLNRAASSKLARLRYGDSEYGYASGPQSDYVRADRPTPSSDRSTATHGPDSEELSATRRMPAVSATDSEPDPHANDHAGSREPVHQTRPTSRRLKRAQPDELD